jgi:hypothetical protein
LSTGGTVRTVEDESGPVCYVTTVGRASMRRHRIEIWYLERGNCLYLLSGYGEKADWVRNLLVGPEVTVQMPPTLYSVSRRAHLPGRSGRG